MDLQSKLRGVIEGDVDASDATRELYSHDASLFELIPEVVVSPKHSKDIQTLVRFVSKHKAEYPDLSVTPRSGGTDMSGGAIGQSIIVDITKHLNQVLEVTSTSAHVQPGLHFRNLDPIMAEKGAMLPSYPASRELCTVGGMVSNNSGGEKSLQYGKTANFVTELKVVFADGNEYSVKPLQKDELVRKMSQKDFEGDIYKRIFELCEKHYDEIKSAQPKVSKDSTGYHLWDVWDRESGVFDLGKLIIGSQGTLGIITDIKFRLVPRPAHSGLLVCYVRDISKLGEIINTVLTHKPATFESFDDNTLWLSFKFFPAFIKKLGFWRWARLGLQLIPDGLALLKGVPHLILMIEFTGESVDEVEQKIDAMRKDLVHYKFTYMEKDETEDKAQKFWIMRRESFNLLRQKVKDKHTAPFIDDLIVPPPRLPEFLPKLRVIIKKYKLLATIAGHMGDGNFHIIPLMKIEDPNERAKLQPAMKEVNDLVLSHDGSLSGEHNDGMVRGPWLERMYGPVVFGHMKEVKRIFDADNIFNPHKKTDADWDFSFSKIRQKF